MERYPEMMQLEEFSGNYVYFEGNFEALVPIEKIEEDIEAIMIDKNE